MANSSILGELKVEAYGSVILPNDPRHPRYDPNWTPPPDVVVPEPKDD